MKKVLVLLMIVMFTCSTIPKKSEAIVFSGPALIIAGVTITWQAIATTITLAIIGGVAFAVAEDGTHYALNKIGDNVYQDANGNLYDAKKTFYGKVKLVKR